MSAAARSPPMTYGSAWTAASLTIPRGPGADRTSPLDQAGDREAGAHRVDLGGDGRQRGRLLAIGDRAHDEPADGHHLVRPEAARRHRRGADPDARSRVGWQWIEGDGVLVDGDADLVEELLGLLAGHPQGRHVDE